jgi:hypothetical protein
MPAFDSSFDSSFDSVGAGGGGEPVPVLLSSGVASATIKISVINPLVFDSAAGYVKWYATVHIGSVDVSSRLSGQLSITAAEDSARLASFAVTPLSAAELAAYDSAAVTIDVTLFRAGQSATWRRFTGCVEGVEYNPAQQLATLSCRDGWQERPKACVSAYEVESLFGGLASPCRQIVKWSDTEPDPVSYFRALLDTMIGATAIDSAGVWQAVPWSFATPDATFGPGDIFDDSLTVDRPNRADVPVSVSATLTHRYPRLHAADLALSWQAVERVRYVVDGLPLAPKSMIQEALTGASGWLIKGTPTLTSPVPGTYMVVVGASSVPYILSPQVAEISCEEMSAVMHRRWYQMVDVRYTVTIAMGGLSDRDDAASATIESDFEPGAWETAPTAESSLGLYADNAPTPAAPPTGYEGLLPPHPPANGALDHHADVDSTVLGQAAAHVVARALRRAAAGKRQQRLAFQRPIDPRWEIGSVLAVSAYGTTGTGQVIEFIDTLDHDSGLAASAYRLACPDGSGETTAFSAAVTPPAVSVSHGLGAPTLGNPVGAAFETPAVPDESLLQGFLSNVLPSSPNYDAAKPVYQAQFRLILPEIPEAVRDPLTINAAIAATVQFAGSGVEVII